ncbi:hypothetical protein [Actinomadura rubrisoli]|uniref:Uncharacterized protein n=1 Tax=Actinomadura rubrisoli TaxID=2530368 RepID=A0A4R5AW81_9ACTN|nr:hypothetical protein [Actinomadura rubrisoli]TDD77708.1 hypothetical protein E1298_29710 [Actinomadura rubrisoli]
MSDSHDLAARFAVLKTLATRVSDAKKAADCEIRDGWAPGDRNTAKLPDGTAIGSVTLAKGRATSRLVDEPAYLTWVEKTHPERIETITLTRVDPAFTERLLSAARQLGVAVDGETGEEVPGIRVEQGDPYPTTRLNAGAAEAIGRAWQDGRLADLVGSLLRPAVEAGDR